MDRTKDPTTRRAIGRRAALPALLGLIMTACAADRGAEPPEGTGAPPATPHESPAEAELGDPIALDELPVLPGEGVAVQLGEGLVFVDLDGNVHGHVPEATLQYMRSLQHVPAGLVPVAGEEYGAGWLELGSTGQQLDRYELPRPADMPDDMTTTGHFLSAELADGWILAGASMECEANKAALIDVGTGELQPILKEDEPLTLGATALGWTGDGRAAVLVDEQPCADNGVPGVWLIDPAASEAELIYALSEGASAEGHLWRPVPGIDLAARASGGVAGDESGE